MSQTTIEWQKAKAEKLLRRQVEVVIAETQYPDAALAEGMIEMAYAAGLFDDVQYGYWERRVAIAVSDRRKALAAERIASLLVDWNGLIGVKA
jgi:hypothetical protein